IVIASLIVPSAILSGCASHKSEPNYESDNSVSRYEATMPNETKTTETLMLSQQLKDENEVIAERQAPKSNVLSELDQAIEDIPAHQESDIETEELMDESLLITQADFSEQRPAKTIFKFGFDKKDLPADEKDIIEQHGRFLAQHPEKSIQLHGHADAQGNPIYNQHLATERANHIAQLLQQQGVTKDQIEIISWGADKPASNGNHWQDHRRVELIYDETLMVQAP
ncbi:MAG: OmpA family protein, partial [Pseudomonadales bacterium]|nr:OmpA family protein [Pseudomonadales bacterium]